MADDEFRDLLQAAKDALCDLIMGSEPGTGMILHQAYTAVKDSLEKDSREVSTQTRSGKVQLPDWHEAFTMAEREQQVLEILSVDRLTIRQLTERLNKNLCPDVRRIFDSEIRSVVNRLTRARELDRAPETYNAAQVRFRYFKRTELDGPIAEIDRAFDSEGGQA